MLLESPQISAALDKISEHISLAQENIVEFAQTDNEYAESSGEWHIHIAYLDLLMLTEATGLPLLRGQIVQAYEEAQKNLTQTHIFDGELYANAPVQARRFHRVLED